MGLLAACEGPWSVPPSVVPTSDTGSAVTDTAGSRSTEDPTSPTSDTGSPLDPCATPTLVLGTGADAFVALSPGGGVELVHGPQGGWHVDVSARVTAMGSLAALQPRLIDVATQTQLAGDQPTTYATLDDAGGCTGEHTGLRAFVDDPGTVDQAYVCSLEGAALQLELTVTDVNTKVQVSDAIAVTAVLDPDDVSACR